MQSTGVEKKKKKKKHKKEEELTEEQKKQQEEAREWRAAGKARYGGPPGVAWPWHGGWREWQ